MNEVKSALKRLIDQALDLTSHSVFESIFETDWLSPCEISQMTTRTLWQPQEQTAALDFTGLANAAEQAIHSDIQHFYSAYWSGSLPGNTHEGPVSLIQLWNQSDFHRLLENLIGHLHVKKCAKEAFTIFFATTDPESELFLSIHNQTGIILLEEPGKPPIREVDENIVTFLNRVEVCPNSQAVV